MLCLDTRQPENVIKILHTRQSDIFLEFPRKTSSNPSVKTVDLCLEMSNDFNYNFGFVVEEIFERGHNRKSPCFDT